MLIMEINPNFSKLNGLIPCIVQDADTDKVLMLAFMNEEALAKTQSEKRATFYSRSRQQLWTKGETSGHYLTVRQVITDCDRDTILLKVTANGPTCHTGQDTCFNEPNEAGGLAFLEKIIKDRKRNPSETSYTSRLFAGGINGIAQKVGEEAVELVIEAMTNNNERLLEESADLLYHFLILLAAKDVTLEQVIALLRTRHQSRLTHPE